MTRIRLFLFIIAILAPSLAAAQQSMKFEEAAAMLAASCGKDIDDNCRGVNLDPQQPEGMPEPQRRRECRPKCQANSIRAFSAGSSSASPRVSTLIEAVQLGNEPSVQRGAKADPAKGLQCLLELDQKGDTEIATRRSAAAGYR